MGVYDQIEFDIRCEWGLPGLQILAPASDVIIIIDVLSFSTTVSICVSRGALVYPYPARDAGLISYAGALKAQIAGHRREGGYSLSPASVLPIPPGTRLVLPSLNGGRLSTSAVTKTVMCGCLRNAHTVAQAAARLGSKITLIPAGERWPQDGSLRPALEDILAAGAIISYLEGRLSPEAALARAAFAGMRSDLLGALRGCSSGKELIQMGFTEDVRLSAELNSDQYAPVLKEGAFQSG